MLQAGAKLPETVDAELAVTLRLFAQGGEAILDGIAAQGFDTLRGRPVVSKRDKAQAAGGSGLWQAAGRFSVSARQDWRNVSTAEAYQRCREIARREAKNFYWAFRVLPKHKSDAMCAVYAFMRRADDISDDESKSVDDRRALMQRWVHAWRASQILPCTPDGEQDAVFVALAGHAAAIWHS